MEASDLLPRKVFFKLTKAPAREFIIEFFTLDDLDWLKLHYPGDKFIQIFSSTNYQDILKVAAHQLDKESKRFLSKLKIIDFDDIGNEYELNDMTMAEKLYKICTDVDLIKISQALLEVRTISNELVSKLAEEMQKKREEESKKMEEEVKLTNGLSSSTP